MGFWGSLGRGLLKAAPMIAAPFTGGASLAFQGLANKGAEALGNRGQNKGVGPSQSPQGGYGQRPAFPGQTPGYNGGYLGGGRGGAQQNPGAGGKQYNPSGGMFGGMSQTSVPWGKTMAQSPYQQGGPQGQFAPQSSQRPMQMPWAPYQGEDVGHEGTTKGGMNRQQFRDAWMQSGISNPQQMDQWLAQHGGQRLNEAGVVRTPFGETLDMGIGYKTGAGRPGWTDIGMNEQAPQQGWQQPPQPQYQTGGGVGPSQDMAQLAVMPQQGPQYGEDMFRRRNVGYEPRY